MRITKRNGRRSKADVLLEEGTLNPAFEKVLDPKFRESEFFDPRDIVQVKYEMLRRVSVENASVTDAALEYGVSRPTYYQAKANLEEAGIAALVPKKPGPRGPHKIQGEVLAFLKKQLVQGQPIRARELATLVHSYGLRSHYDRLRDRGMLTSEEAAARLGVHVATLLKWAKNSIVTRHAYNAHAYLYELPSQNLPVKHCSRWNRLVDRAAAIKIATESAGYMLANRLSENPDVSVCY